MEVREYCGYQKHTSREEGREDGLSLTSSSGVPRLYLWLNLSWLVSFLPHPPPSLPQPVPSSSRRTPSSETSQDADTRGLDRLKWFVCRSRQLGREHTSFGLLLFRPPEISICFNPEGV